MRWPRRFVALASHWNRDAPRTQFEHRIGQCTIFLGIVEGLSRHPQIPSFVPEHDRHFDSIALIQLRHQRFRLRVLRSNRFRHGDRGDGPDHRSIKRADGLDPPCGAQELVRPDAQCMIGRAKSLPAERLLTEGQ